LATVGVLFAAAPAGSATPAWSVSGPIAGAQYGRLAAVSCVSPASCFAVGAADTPTTETRLVARWNGANWQAQANQNPPGASDSQFTSVHCRTSTSCVAVGQYVTAGKTKTLVERWNGAKWLIEASPNPPAIAVSGLSSVQCASATFCVAVGSYFEDTSDSSAEKTLVEQWSGSSWAIVPSPNRVNAIDSGLTGVSCTSASNCFAVGHFDTNLVTRTLIEHWDGGNWLVVSSPNPANVAQSELSGVACVNATRCLAVGSGRGTLVERWNGTSWLMMTSPNPLGATGASLTGVSCPSPTRCYAVSDSFKGKAVQRLVETWNGTGWGIVATPLPAGTIRSSLNGVSCATTASCFAVGEYRLGTSRRPLINRYS
jgi:hypothetical protein